MTKRTRENEKSTPKADVDDEVRSEGQRLLLEVELSGAELAAQLGCSRQAVSFWRAGSKRPGKPIQVKIEELHGIPAGAWFELPHADGATPGPVAAPEPRPRDELREVELLIEEIRATRATGKLQPRERDQNIRTETDLLKRRTEIEERAERARKLDAMLEHEVVVTILDILKRYPNVEAEVMAALRAKKRAA